MDAAQVLEVWAEVETDPESEEEDRALLEYASESDSDPEDLSGPSHSGSTSRTTRRAATVLDWRQISAGKTISRV